MSVIVDDGDLVSVLVDPAKADAPLSVDPDAVLAAAVSFQEFQLVSRRKAHDFEAVGGVELQEFAAGGALDIGRETAQGRAMKNLLRFGIGEGFDHRRNLSGVCDGCERKLREA
jgi:hypothetical protein